MKVLILKPRLDVMFKKSIITSARGHVQPIRMHWERIVDKIQHKHRQDDVYVYEAPLWQFSPELVDSFGADIAYIPHKEQHNFGCKTNAMFYMQTVFPWRFYVDSKGFAGGSTLYGMSPDQGNADSGAFEKLREYVLSGKSKFDQPTLGALDTKSLGEYILFPCQIPHDETIKYHSDVTVEQALDETCRVTESLGIKLVVKGHPVNPSSMHSLKQIANQYKHTVWYDTVHIHDLISNAKVVVVVNSGCGMESLLHKKPVITYGRAEYDCVTMKCILNNNLRELLSTPVFNEFQVKKFFDKWCSLTCDTTN